MPEDSFGLLAAFHRPFTPVLIEGLDPLLVVNLAHPLVWLLAAAAVAAIFLAGRAVGARQVKASENSSSPDDSAA